MSEQNLTYIGLRIIIFLSSLLLILLPAKLAPEEVLEILGEIDFTNIESGVKSTLLIILVFAFILLLFSFIYTQTLVILTSILLPDTSVINNVQMNIVYLIISSLLLTAVLISHHVEVVERPQMEDYEPVD